MRFVVTSIILFSFSFQTSAQLKHPENLRFNFDESTRVIQLAWDEVDNAVGYNVFFRKTDEEEYLLLGEAGMLYQNTFNYSVKSEFGQHLEFAVCAVNNYPSVERSVLSESIKVETTSVRLPMVKLNTPKLKNGKVTVSWEYPYDIQDLSSFVLLINGIPKSTSITKKELILDNLPKGNHTIQLEARSQSGVTSPRSTLRFVTIR